MSIFTYFSRLFSPSQPIDSPSRVDQGRIQAMEEPAPFVPQIPPQPAFDQQPIQARTVEAASMPEDLSTNLEEETFSKNKKNEWDSVT